MAALLIQLGKRATKAGEEHRGVQNARRENVAAGMGKQERNTCNENVRAENPPWTPYHSGANAGRVADADGALSRRSRSCSAGGYSPLGLRA